MSGQNNNPHYPANGQDTSATMVHLLDREGTDKTEVQMNADVDAAVFVFVGMAVVVIVKYRAWVWVSPLRDQAMTNWHSFNGQANNLDSGTRERAWSGRPIVRVPHLSADTNVNSEQLTLRVQLREGYLITGRGGIPPRPCRLCRDPSRINVSSQCVSGGAGEKCNNCLYIEGSQRIYD
ncbi:hypothetical protein FQN54_007624 [Arachnomyces sp. PD_36]|nr:hypothetical protein FQN54_007624 [Arachnomyces sp. PD_36]